MLGSEKPKAVIHPSKKETHINQKAKVLNEKGFWQVVNLVLPLLMILLLGIIYNNRRKAKYTK